MGRLFAYLTVTLLLAAWTGAQQNAANPPAGAHAKASVSRPDAPAVAQTKLPSEDTVKAFLQQMFGYDPTLTWKIIDIRPSIAEGLAQVSVLLTGPQGSQGNTLYVTPDGKHALVGEIIPFGVKPFAADHEKLVKE